MTARTPSWTRRIARRDFLKGTGPLGLGAIAAPLLACAPSTYPGSSTPAPSPTSRSGPTPIRHVLVAVQENRSFDHYYGFAPFIDDSYGIPPGYRVADGNGGFVVPHHIPTLASPDISHSWSAMHAGFG